MMTITRATRNMLNHSKGRLTQKKINSVMRRENMTSEEKKSKKLKRDIALARSKRQGKGFSQINSHVTEYDEDAYASPISCEEEPWWCFNNNVGGQLNAKQRGKAVELDEERFGKWPRTEEEEKKLGFAAY
jgi:hypothetical protein